METKEILVEAEKFAEEVLRPQASKIDKQGYLPVEIIQEMGRKGFLGAIFPKEYGGLELDLLSYGKLTEIIGKASCAARTVLTVHTSLVGETLLKIGNDYQKEKYLRDIVKGKKIGCFALSEPNVGTDANSVQTTYRENENSFILTGHKKWISLSCIADLFLVIANGENGMCAFIVEKKMPGITLKPIEGLMAGRGTYIGEIEFDEVEVPKENLVGRKGSGFNFVANTALFYGRYSIAWAGLGLAQAALEEMVTYARTRKQFGTKIGEFQLIQGIIADSVTKVHAGRALCNQIGELRNTNTDAVMETNLAKYYTSKIAMEVTTNAIQVLGGNGCCDKYPLERLFREAKVLEIIEGSSQIQQVMLAKYGMRKYYNKKLIRED